jgi:hypothetical protein
MTPQEKAKELFSKYMPDLINELGVNDDTYELNRKFALIAVDEILNLMIKEFKWDTKHNGHIIYWQEVKQEIENL